MLFIVFNNEILLPYDGDVVAVVLRWTENIDEGFWSSRTYYDDKVKLKMVSQKE